MSGAEEDRKRAARAEQVALFRYQLIREAADPALSTRQRGRLVRELAARAHPGPFDGPVTVSRETIDRWIRAWRAGGFAALAPPARQVTPRTDAAVLELAAGLKRENPARTAAQVMRILRASCGWSPSVRTLQRHFERLELTTRPDGRPPQAFGRFEASRPNELWTGDALHGPPVAGRKAYLFAFLDDHSRAVMAARWGYFEDSVRLAAALRPALAARGVPDGIYVFVLDTPAESPIYPATCRNAAPAGSLTFQAQPEIVRQRLHNPGDRKVCRGRWESSPGHVRPAGLARRAAWPGCLPGGVHRGLPGIPGRPWLQPADHRQRRGDSRAVP
jgi:transposase